jgi:hypothetical protein
MSHFASVLSDTDITSVLSSDYDIVCLTEFDFDMHNLILFVKLFCALRIFLNFLLSSSDIGIFFLIFYVKLVLVS